MATQVFVTDAGRAALLLGPVTLGNYKLGSAYNYTPNSSDTDIRGSVVLTGATSAPVITYINLYNYRIDLPSDQDFTFGEIALFFPNGTLFALYAFEQEIIKTADPADLDGSGGTIHFFVPATGDSVADLNAGELLGQITTVDDLPNAAISPLPMYTVVHPVHTPVPILAFKLYDLWGLSNYSQQYEVIITSAGLNRVTTAGRYDAEQGDVVQFMDGPYKGVCRKILSAHYTLNETTFVFVNPLSGTPPTPGAKVALSTPFINTGSGSPGDISSLALLRDGSVIMDGTFNMGGHTLTNLATPLGGTDAATKQYVDQQVQGVQQNANYLLRDGSVAMAGMFNFANFRGINLGTPSVASDAATKGYVDSAISTGGIPTSPVNYNNQRIFNLGAPTLATDAATKGYVDNSLNSYLPRSGAQPMTGILNMGSNRIQNVADPINSSDAVNLNYVNSRLNPTGVTFNNVNGARSFNMNGVSQLILNLNGNTVISFTAGTIYDRFVVKIQQDSSASRTVSFGSMVRFSQDIPSYTLVTSANRFDYLGFIIEADNTYRLVAITQGFQ